MSVAKKCAYVSGMIKKHGLRGLVVKVMERRQDPIEKDYIKNWKSHMVTEVEWNIQRNTRFERMPLVSVVVPAYETPEHFMEALVESLQKQSYANWELCIADAGMSNKVENVVSRYAKADNRIKYSRLAKNSGIAENTNMALRMAAGEFIGLLDHDDVLAPNALYEVVRMINAHPESEVIYSDEDKIDETGELHMRPHFKLDYNRELLLHYNYICHFLVIKAALLDKVGNLNASFDGAQDYDLVLRLSEQTEQIFHIRRVLYHWRVHKNSTAGSSLAKDYAYDAGKRALEAHFDRMHIKAEVKEAAGRAHYEICYDASDMQMEEIDYKDCTSETLDERIRTAKTEYILLRNSHLVGTIPEDKKRELLALCMQHKTGLVGVRVRKGRHLISSGIDCRSEEDCGYLYEGLPAVYEGYFGRASIPQNVRAVPLEFCVIRREAYEQAGLMEFGPDLVVTALHFADQIRQAGYEVVLDAKVTVKYKG